MRPNKNQATFKSVSFGESNIVEQFLKSAPPEDLFYLSLE